MVDIFSTFDDHNFVFFSYLIMWVFSLASMCVVFSLKWVSTSGYDEVINILRSTPGSGANGSVVMGGFHLFIVGFFLSLVNMNMSGLIPYVFSVTAHLSVSFSFGLVLWLSLIISSYCYNFLVSASGLLPTGSPSALAPFLVLVETVSIGVRPITISVRLVANISAGHIILTLISNSLCDGVFTFPIVVLMLVLAIEIFYFLFEFGVAIIQGYIFCLLVSLYSNEHA
uniref:ATP synthase subunit a n=1 Tax=Patella ferruginea TaxID=87961 RepID=A0A481MVL6_PATFE|nr:ATP synthase F0 subunit 6 [Patella ferruginea]